MKTVVCSVIACLVLYVLGLSVVGRLLSTGGSLVECSLFILWGLVWMLVVLLGLRLILRRLS